MKTSWINIVLLAILFLHPNCGRKQRTLFVFPKPDTIKISKLKLPAVRNLSARLHNNYIIISWDPISAPPSYSPELKVAGYFVYRATRGKFIPKQPMNSEPVTTTSYEDRTKNATLKENCYLVRGVFTIDDKTFLGPSSNLIMCIK